MPPHNKTPNQTQSPTPTLMTIIESIQIYTKLIPNFHDVNHIGDGVAGIGEVREWTQQQTGVRVRSWNTSQV